MTLVHQDPWLTIHEGDCRAVMAEMEPESVHMVCTSPPFWGLRDYGVTGQLGLEATPDEYVASMVAVFREVRRVLRADGTVWLNLGDSYAADGRKGRAHMGKGKNNGYSAWTNRVPPRGRSRDAALGGDGCGDPESLGGLKQKDLVGIPWRVAFALQADGWYLRSDIIWSKPNPMPESVTDRPTKAHEMVFLLAKGQWKSRVVQLANLPSERVHLGDYGGSQSPNVWASEFAVRIATAILDGAQVKDELGLSGLDAQIGQERPTDSDGIAVARLPGIERATELATRLLQPEGSAKEFLSEIYRLGISLTDSNQLLIGGGAAVLPLPPTVNRYGEGAIAIHHPSEVRQFDLVHGTIVASRPSTCTYYYDADAVREPHTASTLNRIEYGLKHRHPPDVGVGIPPVDTDRMGERFANPAGRNMRSVWTIATQPYPGAHFATFPEALVEPCVKAGTSEKGVCPECGAPWVRVVERTRADEAPELAGYLADLHATTPTQTNGIGSRSAVRFPNSMQLSERGGVPSTTTGWRPSCFHDAAPVPATILDPFAGSGTTGRVAQRLSRRAVLIDLNAEYLEQAMGRNRDIPLGLGA